MNLENQIEAILFWKGEPVKIKKLAEILAVDESTISAALINLEKNLENRGLVLVHKEDEVTLGTAPDISPLIEKLTKEELIRDLGKAGLETLSIIIYKGPISRADIDYIRGVQSTFILRNLSIRGLVERVTNPKDQRSFLYKPTFELLQYLGVAKIEDMPEFEAVKTELATFEAEKQKTSENTIDDVSMTESPAETEIEGIIPEANDGEQR
ncbi:MAG: SMC-Scp complex subunit ScpB [Minisyncoccia bacterium]